MFEVHITTRSIVESEIDQFLSFCESIDAKAILIELPQGQTTQQPMISKVYAHDVGNLKVEIEKLRNIFIQNGYDLIRTKVEVPLEFINQGRKQYPDYHGQYFEWHGKVEFKNIVDLQFSLKHLDAHISRSSLKDQADRRFVTVRAYRNKNSFLSKVRTVKNTLDRHKIKLIKDEYEYCIFDSNKTIDNGWIDIPEITDKHYLNLLAFEGFLRRAVDIEAKFILKGSLITRQYISEKKSREVMDLDFVYGEFIDVEMNAAEIFTDWVTKVTETEVSDNISYRSFKENEFWRLIDYAMDDDFPTTNTDLSCVIGKFELPIVELDISWNLPLEQESVPLLYKAVDGDEFVIPYTVALETQIAWKLHQSVVRPRAKDLIDVILLLESNELSREELTTVCQVYSNECKKDNINPGRVLYYLNNEVSSFLRKKKHKIDESYDSFWLLDTPFGFSMTSAMNLTTLDDVFKIDFGFEDVQDLTYAFEQSLIEVGLLTEIEKMNTFLPTRNRKWYQIWKNSDQS